MNTHYRGRLRASHDPTLGPDPTMPMCGDPGAEAGPGDLGEDTGNEKIKQPRQHRIGEKDVRKEGPGLAEGGAGRGLACK